MTSELELGSALTPLRERYAHWLSLDQDQVVADREEAVHDIRAMQLVLRMERADPPSWHQALVAAAIGAAALCLDARSEPGGEWHEAIRDYCVGHIRKVTRRARGAHWAAAQELPGITIDRDGTQVRVLVPGRVTELDPRISRLQVGGTDAPEDQVPVVDSNDLPNRRLQIWLPPEPRMTLGKSMAQAGHAGMIAAALLAGDDPVALRRWRDDGCPVVVHGRTTGWDALRAAVESPTGWQDGRLLAVRDAGFTEIDPGTVTVIAKAFRT